MRVKASASTGIFAEPRPRTANVQPGLPAGSFLLGKVDDTADHRHRVLEHVPWDIGLVVQVFALDPYIVPLPWLLDCAGDWTSRAGRGSAVDARQVDVGSRLARWRSDRRRPGLCLFPA